MFRRLATAAVFSLALASPSLFSSPTLAADAKPHHIAIQVDQNDPQVMNMALGNANNMMEYYKSKNEEAVIDITAYGPGLHMLRADTSPVADRIKKMKETFGGKIAFSACNNTKQNMEKTEGHAIPILSDASLVPSGAAHLSELQEQGWSYIKP